MPEKLSFKPFNEKEEVRVYYNGFLPHWRQNGCTYFVTFRLADSVPRKVIEEWKYERDAWLKVRGIDPLQIDLGEHIVKLSASEQLTFERHFAGKLFQFLDRGHGGCQLREAAVSKIVFDALLHLHGERVETGDLVVMPNHVHALLTPLPGYELEEVLHSIKSFTANRIDRQLKRSGTLWMEESYDHIVRYGEELVRIQKYIEHNPMRAHLTSDEFIGKQAVYDFSNL